MGKKHIVCALSVPDFRVLINGQLCYVALFSGLQRSSFAFYTASHDSRGGGGGGGGRGCCVKLGRSNTASHDSRGGGGGERLLCQVGEVQHQLSLFLSSKLYCVPFV